MKIQLKLTLALLLTALLLPLSIAAANGNNIDLSTVPDRASVQLTIYNSEDITLVRETRKVSFKKGANALQFSWANTLIDASSVELRFLQKADKLSVMDTTFPHDKPQMLYWNVQSEFDGEAMIQITYFTSGLTWAADYVAVTNPDESEARLEGFVRVTNGSGEDYENAQVRLVVGTINLVEKIAQLARISMKDAEELKRNEVDRFQSLRRDAAREMMAKGEMAAFGAAKPAAAPEPKEIVREGLSEYFIFTIDGTETVPNGWAKRLRAIDADKVPVKIQYRYHPREFGDRLMRMYLMTNNKDSKLGGSPLPDGIVRVFRQNGRDGLSFLTQHNIKYIPIGEKIELPLGVDPQVVFELIPLKAFRDNIWMRFNGVDVFKRVDDGAADIDVNSSVVGWDDHKIFTQRVRNYSPKAINVEVERSFDGHVVFRSGLEPRLFDYRTVVFNAQVKPAEKRDLKFEIVRHQGRNAKQNNITLEAKAVE